MNYAELRELTRGDKDVVGVSGYANGQCTVEVAERAGGYYDPNALAIHTLDGAHIGYVGKKDPLRLRLLERANKEEATLPVLVANYYEDGEKLWESVEKGDMVQLWLRAFSKTPLEDNSFVEIESFTGEKVLWSEYLHICTDLQGNELMGGSTYASQFEKEFDTINVAKKWAKKNEYNTEDVVNYWNSLGKLSQDYGTSIHTALEHYSKSFKSFGHEKSLPRQPHLREAVKQFLKVSNFDNCVAEPLITDVERGMSGWVDNLRLLGNKTISIEDYKTNTFNEPKDYPVKWESKLKTYQRQLDYYGTILLNHGYTVKPHTIWHFHEGKWDRHQLDFKPVKNYIKE